MKQSLVPEALRILDKAGTEPPRSGDEVPIDVVLDQTLREGIRTKRLLRFEYKGQPRTVEPHDYGIQNGIVRVFCWQVGGHSSSRLPGWRMFDVEGIESCEMLEKHFPGNREVSGKHHQWDEIFIRVSPPEGSSLR